MVLSIYFGRSHITTYFRDQLNEDVFTERHMRLLKWEVELKSSVNEEIKLYNGTGSEAYL